MNRAAKILKKARKRLHQHLSAVVTAKSFNYRTFGTEIEESIIDEIIKIFVESDLIKDESDYQIARNKNEFPDFLLKSILLAVDIKSGSVNRKKGNEWVVTNNSNNDLGTLNEWPRKIDEFGEENIYFVFIIYNFTRDKNIIVDVQIDNFYRFVGKSKQGLLRYREKDGNLRPRNFTARPSIEDFQQFKDLLKQTVTHRSINLIKKHSKNVPKKVLRTVFRGILRGKVKHLV